MEFDLENIFANRDEREFNTLYSIIHSSRFNSKVKEGTLLIDRFQKDSVTEGVKIGDILRNNVEHALELLGNELIQQNLDKIDLDKIDVNEFYAELLRIIYRIIFILYAEQRDMLPGAGSLYFEQFSLSSLRIRAEKPIKAEKNYDLCNKMLITFNLVRDGNFLLGVNSYNGSLFKEDNLRIILKNSMKISNDIVLKVIRLLTTSANHKVRQRINFLEVSEEEIGAIYESLLDFKPYISSTSQFQLIEGTERKSTGSYYTPKALIDILIRTTLQTLVEDRLIEAGDDEHARESALLDLKVCDPACGGGTFLLSALDYLGKKLAEVRTSSDSPLEDDLREARREILQHCIYGVDMNPLAVELAKISLWLRACVKDKPLNFLDNHIKCGNSLVGLGQKMEIKEINPNAFKAISGSNTTGIPTENTKLQNQARNNIRKEIKERKKEGKTTMITSFFTDKRTADICSAKFMEIIDMPETDSNKIREKEQKYEDLRLNENYQQALNEAHIWTSTFFWPFEGDSLGEIPRYTTIEQLRDKIADPELDNLMKKLNKIANENQFFQWYIEFPEVFSTAKGGFDCILTNPPWAALQLKETEFFSGINTEIVNAQNQSQRRKLIKQLKKKKPRTYNLYKTTWQKIQKFNHYLRNCGFYDLSAKGTINTYAVFTERCWNLISKKGYVGIIIPTGIITTYNMRHLFKALVKSKSILSLFDFENKNKIFDIHRNYRFCLLSLGGKNIFQETIPMTFKILDPREIQEPLFLIFQDKEKLHKRLSDLPLEHILIPLRQEDFELFNPNSLNCPIFKIKRDVELLRHLYLQAPILIKRDPKSNEIISNNFKVSFKRMFDMSSDSKIFMNYDNLISNGYEFVSGNKFVKDDNIYLPLYEAKMIQLYNHRHGTFDGQTKIEIKKGLCRSLVKKELEDFSFSILPRYWVEKDIVLKRNFGGRNIIEDFLIVFRRITRAVEKRTIFTAIIPPFGCGDSLQIINFDKMIEPNYISAFIANFNSIIIDYIIRSKFTGAVLNVYVVEQIPFIMPESYNKRLLKLINNHVIKLIYNSNDLISFAKFMNYKNDPNRWNDNERSSILAELDAIYAHLYVLKRDELIYILESFDSLKKSEKEEFNEYRTKRIILEAYDNLSEQKELFE